MPSFNLLNHIQKGASTFIAFNFASNLKKGSVEKGSLHCMRCCDVRCDLCGDDVYISLCLFTLLAFTFPVAKGFTWWAWAVLSSLHLLGNPIIEEAHTPTLSRRIILGMVWFLLFFGTLTVSLDAIPTAVLPEANISQEVEL